MINFRKFTLMISWLSSTLCIRVMFFYNDAWLMLSMRFTLNPKQIYWAYIYKLFSRDINQGSFFWIVNVIRIMIVCCFGYNKITDYQIIQVFSNSILV